MRDPARLGKPAVAHLGVAGARAELLPIHVDDGHRVLLIVNIALSVGTPGNWAGNRPFGRPAPLLNRNMPRGPAPKRREEGHGGLSAVRA